MTFSPQELRLLQLADAADSTPAVGQGKGGGRPRTRPDTPVLERRRARALAAYYTRKAKRMLGQ